ncbi:MAG TPA: DUF1353 domain-containing protein [Dehalococcoidia bacterium]|nr:DUF1353 domain-containing protein [Dehalococcoidia bacterium]
MMSKFVGNLVVEVINDDSQGVFKLQNSLTFISMKTHKTVTAPKGFITDFCSVPWVPGIYELLGGKARKSGTIHDYLYSKVNTDRIGRSMADSMLREMVQVEGVPVWQSWLFYFAVRLFGWHFWQKKK